MNGARVRALQERRLRARHAYRRRSIRVSSPVRHTEVVDRESLRSNPLGDDVLLIGAAVVGFGLFHKQITGALGAVVTDLGTSIAQAIQGGNKANQPGPANRPSLNFNINTDAGVSQVRIVAGGALGAAVAGAHVGVGHSGTAGTFVCRLWMQSAGLWGVGGTGPVQIGEQQFSVGADTDVTGYGIDFGPSAVGPLSGFWSPIGMSAWADISDTNGNLYTQAPIATQSP